MNFLRKTSARSYVTLIACNLAIFSTLLSSESFAAGQSCNIVGELAKYCTSHGKLKKAYQGYDLIVQTKGVARIVHLKFKKNSNKKFKPGKNFRATGVLNGKVFSLNDDSKKSIDSTNSGHSTTCNLEQSNVVGANAVLASAGSIPVPLNLSSKPGAKANLYLNFGGSTVSTWGSYSNVVTPAYDQDGVGSSFSSSEIASMTDIWQKVAEKFAPFNINVTTVDPGNLTDKVTLRADIGGNGSWLGQNAGGVAYVGSFTNYIVNVVYIFTANLGNGNPKYTAEAVAHEAGHGFNLEHQSSYDASGNKTAEYFGGNGSTSPIMGSSYYAPRGLWWYGTSAMGATSYQDDLAIIANTTNGFGLRIDDFGNSVSTAANLPVDANGSGSISGVIEKISDSDYFRFSTAAGTVSLFAAVDQSGPTLNLKLALYNSAGTLITSADTASLGESISTDLTAGTYFVAVSSHGEYGDVAQYTLGAQVIPTGVTCIRSNPTLIVSPSTQSISAGNSANYSASLQNNDTSGCPSSTFSLSYLDSSGDIDGSINPVSVSLLPSAVGNFNIPLTSLANSAGGVSSFSVTASDGLHESVQSTGSATIVVPDRIKPSTPTSLAITNVTTATKRQGKKVTVTTKFTLKWAASSDNVGVAGYRVFKNGTLLAQTSSTALSYAESFTTNGTYNYVVKAYDAAGNISDSSNQVTYSN